MLLLATLCLRLCPRAGWDFDAQLADAVQVLNYEPTQWYKPHTDWFDAKSYKGHDPTVNNGTNRFATVFLYLNDVDAGGHTVFPLRQAATHTPTLHSIATPSPNAVAAAPAPAAAAWPPAAPSITVRPTPLPRVPAPSSRTHEGYNGEYLTHKGTEKTPGYISNKDAKWVCNESSPALRAAPIAGNAVLFYSQMPDGTLDKYSLHGGCPVLEGHKWSANVWIWNRPKPGKDKALDSEGTGKSKKDGGIDVSFDNNNGKTASSPTFATPLSQSELRGGDHTLSKRGKTGVLRSMQADRPKRGQSEACGWLILPFASPTMRGHAGKAVYIYWDNQSGAGGPDDDGLTPWGRYEADEQLAMHTFPGHMFVFKEADQKTLIRKWVATLKDGSDIPINPKNPLTNAIERAPKGGKKFAAVGEKKQKA